MDYASVLKFLQSDGGSDLLKTGVSAVGAGITASQQGKRDEKALNQNANQNAASMYQRQLETQQDDDRARAQSVLAARPLGESEEYAQSQLMKRAILGGMKNSSYASADPAIKAARGGSGIDLSGIAPMAARAFTDESILRAQSQRDKDVLGVNPYAARTDMSAFGDAAEPYTSSVEDYATGAASRLQEPRMTAQAKIQAALDHDLAAAEKKKEGGGFWKKLGKVAAFAAPIVAAPFTGGASLALIGAGAGAAGGLLNGGGLKGALLGGALGAIPGVGGAGKVAGAGGNVLRSTALNAAANSIPMAAQQTAGSVVKQMAKQAGTKLLASGGRL
jgi:hypothetical protein